MKRSRFHRKVSPSGQKFEIVFVIGCIFFLQICCQEQLEVAKAPKPALTESKPALTESKPVIPASTTAPAPRKQQPAKAKMASDANKPAPEITFEKLVHDFGEIGAGTRNTCEFKFANTGNALLKIIRIQTCCGVIARLVGNKKEYAPGESGTLTVSYRASRYPGSLSRPVIP